MSFKPRRRGPEYKEKPFVPPTRRQDTKIQTIELEERTVVVCSVESSGATSLIHSLTQETFVNHDGTYRPVAVKHSVDNMIAFMPLFLDVPYTSTPQNDLTSAGGSDMASSAASTTTTTTTSPLPSSSSSSSGCTTQLLSLQDQKQSSVLSATSATSAPSAPSLPDDQNDASNHNQLPQPPPACPSPKLPTTATTNQVKKVGVSLTFVDCGNLSSEERVSTLQKALCKTNFVNCAVICVKAARWGKATMKMLTDTIHNLNKVGIPHSCICLVLTHFDCFRNKQTLLDETMAILLEHNIPIKRMLAGCYLRERLLTETGARVYSNAWDTALDEFLQEVMYHSKENTIVGLKHTRIQPQNAQAISHDEYKKFQRLKSTATVDIKPVPLDRAFIQANVQKGFNERDIILVGMTGVGKSAILSLLVPRRAKASIDSRVSIMPVTRKCIRTSTYAMTFDEDITEEKLKIRAVDTVGLGDAINTPKKVISQIKHYIITHFKQLDLIILCVRIDNWSPTMKKELDSVMEFLVTRLGVTKENVCVVVTHCDFYTQEYRSQFVRDALMQLNHVSKLIDAEHFSNVVFGCAVNPQEVQEEYRYVFEILRKNFTVDLQHQIIKKRERIDAAVKLGIINDSKFDSNDEEVLHTSNHGRGLDAGASVVGTYGDDDDARFLADHMSDEEEVLDFEYDDSQHSEHSSSYNPIRNNNCNNMYPLLSVDGSNSDLVEEGPGST